LIRTTRRDRWCRHRRGGRLAPVAPAARGDRKEQGHQCRSL